MADVWKSQGRKFCEICKVWFGDNRASIEFHERGRKHKDALAAKLRELSRASREKEKMQARMSSALAAMEAAALKSMRENGEGIEQGPALPSTGLSSKIFDPRQLKDVGAFAREMAKRKNEMTGMKDQKRAAPPATSSMASKYFKREVANAVDYSEFTVPLKNEEAEGETGPVPSSAQILWAEADAGDGRSYYFHLYTGESTWERPAYFYTKEDYALLMQNAENSSAKVEAPVVKEEVCDESSNKAPDIEETTIPEVKSEPCVEEAANIPHAICDIPLPGPACDGVNAPTNEESPTESTITDTKEEAPMVQPIVSAETIEPEVAQAIGVEENLEKNVPEQQLVEEEASKQPAGPLGSWTRVKKVDSGPVFSPLTAKYRAEEERERKATEAREKQAEKLDPLVFTEKTSAVLTKKVKGPIEFKKRSATKSVRQRTQ
ncbi:Transcription initiation factor IID subunit [Trichostrongylus colubriformis]|uniref:Transcription initiation factor IID subunit n=1 Tax=Trichostrongylus colubriformis TaxID=6319 RepID=A0AAN8IDT0_TRICO